MRRGCDCSTCCLNGTIEVVPDEEYLCPMTDCLQGGVDDISALVEAISPVFEDKAVPWHLDLSRCVDVGIGPATMIVAAVLDSRLRGRAARITLPNFRPEQG